VLVEGKNILKHCKARDFEKTVIQLATDFSMHQAGTKLVSEAALRLSASLRFKAMSQRGTRQTAYRSSIEMITLDKKEHLAELGNTRSLTYKDVDWTSRSICQQYQMLIPLVNRIVAEHRQGEARLTKAPTSVFKNWNKSRKQFTSRLHTLLQILDLPHRHL